MGSFRGIYGQQSCKKVTFWSKAHMFARMSTVAFRSVRTRVVFRAQHNIDTALVLLKVALSCIRVISSLFTLNRPRKHDLAPKIEEKSLERSRALLLSAANTIPVGDIGFTLGNSLGILQFETVPPFWIRALSSLLSPRFTAIKQV